MSHVPDNYVMTVREIADYLQVSQSTIYRLAKGGDLPSRKVGGAWRFSQTAVDAWLAGGAAARLKAQRN